MKNDREMIGVCELHSIMFRGILAVEQLRYCKAEEVRYVKLVTRKGLLSFSTDQSMVISQKEEYNDD
jgi:hypothetical protein